MEGYCTEATLRIISRTLIELAISSLSDYERLEIGISEINLPSALLAYRLSFLFQQLGINNLFLRAFAPYGIGAIFNPVDSEISNYRLSKLAQERLNQVVQITSVLGEDNGRLSVTAKLLEAHGIIKPESEHSYILTDKGKLMVVTIVGKLSDASDPQSIRRSLPSSIVSLEQVDS